MGSSYLSLAGVCIHCRYSFCCGDAVAHGDAPTDRLDPPPFCGIVLPALSSSTWIVPEFGGRGGKMAEKIFIFDTTLRDGEQSPGCSMNLDEKLGMARQLDRLGVDILEAGFPIASQGDFEAVRAISAEIRRPVIAALARASELDVDRAWEALKEAARPRIHTFLATSDIHLKYKLRKTREQVLKQIRSAVGHAASLCGDVE